VKKYDLNEHFSWFKLLDLLQVGLKFSFFSLFLFFIFIIDIFV